MTRTECFRSAGGFLIIGGMSFGSIYLIGQVGTKFVPDPWDLPELAVLLFMYALFMGMSVLGALYLAVRAPFRPTVIPTADVGSSSPHVGA